MNNYKEVTSFPNYTIEKTINEKLQPLLEINCVVPIVRNSEVHLIYVHEEVLLDQHFTYAQHSTYLNKRFLLSVERIQKFFVEDRNVIEQISHKSHSCC